MCMVEEEEEEGQPGNSATAEGALGTGAHATVRMRYCRRLNQEPT